MDRVELAKRINVAWQSSFAQVESMDYYRKRYINEDEVPGEFLLSVADLLIKVHGDEVDKIFKLFNPTEEADESPR